MGVTGAQAVVDPGILEAAVIDVLSVTAPRHIIVLDPIKLTIVNYSKDTPIMLTVPDLPSEPDRTGFLDRILCHRLH